MIARLIDPTNGSVTIDGTDIRQISQYDLHEKVSFTQQKAQLLSGTVRSNLKFGKSDATDEEMWQALEIAQAADFVREQGGLELAVEQNGANFSGGQKQRIALSRIILLNPKIIILDEFTSSIDEKDTIWFYENISKIFPNSTIVAITHHLNALNNFEKVYLLENQNLKEYKNV